MEWVGYDRRGDDDGRRARSSKTDGTSDDGFNSDDSGGSTPGKSGGTAEDPSPSPATTQWGAKRPRVAARSLTEAAAALLVAEVSTPAGAEAVTAATVSSAAVAMPAAAPPQTLAAWADTPVELTEPTHAAAAVEEVPTVAAAAATTTSPAPDAAPLMEAAGSAAPAGDDAHNESLHAPAVGHVKPGEASASVAESEAPPMQQLLVALGRDSTE